MEHLTEFEYLEMFYQEADFGPAHEDVVDIINENIENETGRKIPKTYSTNYED